jgi:hypothetical protein
VTTAGEKPENPYVGPRAFRINETLFGRDRETEAFVDLLLSERIVVLHSQSGAGKTSLLQAKVIPRLASEGLYVLPIVRGCRVPPAPPAVAHNPYVLRTLIDLDRLRNPPRTPEQLATLRVNDYLAGNERERPGTPHVLIFDQFEELLTFDPTALDAKTEFCRQIGVALQTRTRWAIFAMREEFIGAMDPYLQLFPTRLAHRYRLEHLSVQAAQEAIEKPALAKGVEFAPKAVQRLIDDLRQVHRRVRGHDVERQPGSVIEPVYLQVVCTRLWDRLSAETKKVEPTDITSAGNVDDALTTYYAEAVSRAAVGGGTAERDVRRWIERALIRDGLRAQALQGTEQEYGVSEQTVSLVEDAYIVRREERRGAIWYELAHDRLVTPIRDDNERWRNQALSELERRAERWIAEGRPTKLLWNSSQGDALGTLVEFLHWWGKWRSWRLLMDGSGRLNPDLRAYLVASYKRVVWRAIVLYVGAGVLLLAVYAFQGSRNQKRLQREKEVAVSARDSLRTVIDSLQRLQAVLYERVWGLEQATPSLVRQSVLANRALQSAVRTTPPDSGTITIEYFFKRSDPERVEFALRELGYRVRVMQARAEDVATNALSFGQNVPLGDVRIIALAVARTGAQLRRICPFRNPRGGRERIVQVLGVQTALPRPALGVEALRTLGEQGPLPCADGAAVAR